MNYKEFKDEVLRLYHETYMTTLDIAIYLNADRQAVLNIIEEDYGEPNDFEME